MRKKYKENIDFKEIKSNNDLVKIHESLNGDQSTFKKSTHKRGTAKKYYAVKQVERSAGYLGQLFIINFFLIQKREI